MIYRLVDQLRTLRTLIGNYLKNLAVISVAVKVMAVSFILPLMTIAPVAGDETNQKAAETNLTFDKNSQVPVKISEQKIEIVKGESNFDRKIREEREASDTLRSYSQRVAVVRERNYSEPGPLRPIYEAAQARFGVPWQIIEAVHQVESGKSTSTCKKSYAGATGPMQFLPSTWRHYGVDGDGDGSADICNVVDAINGGANLLAANGAASGNVRRGLFAYNHSQAYVNKVLGVAYSIGYGE